MNCVHKIGLPWEVFFAMSWVTSFILMLSNGSVQVQLIEPAVKGTINVLEACSEANVKRVVVVSSGKAVSENPDWPKGRVMDETCWSDKEHCRRTKVIP